MAKKVIASVLVLILILLSGCSRTENSSALPDVSDVKIDENMSRQTALNYDNTVGKVSFEQKDNGVRESVKVSPFDTKDATLTLKDESGRIWSLLLPAGCVPYNVEISMELLYGIKGETELGTPAAGVYFYPSGLEFEKPAILTVSTGNTTSAICSAAYDGSGMKLAIPATVEKNSASNSVYLMHFSTAFLFDFDKGKEQMKEGFKNYAKASYERACKEAEELLEQPITIPQAPSIPATCEILNGKEKTPDFTGFKEAFMEPERTSLEWLIATKRQVAMYGAEDLPTLGDTEQKLLRRLDRKLAKLIKTYYPKEEYLYPVGMTAIQVHKTLTLLGYPDNGTLEQIAEWVWEVTQKVYEDIRSKHEYKKLRVFLHYSRQASILDINGGHWEAKTLEMLNDLLYFRIKYRYDFNGSNGDRISTQADIPVSFDIHGEYESLFDAIAGSGDGQYSDYFMHDAPEVKLETDSYQVSAMLRNFNPCEGKVEVVIDRITADVENQVYPGGNVVKFDPGIPRLLNGQLFGENLSSAVFPGYESGRAFAFKENIRNGDAVMVDKEYQKNMNEVSVKLTVQVYHEPK